jgi:glycosyltransferase involved in cell wall biosynthesis
VTAPPPLAVVVKGYPRLSETFVAQELAGLEARGIAFDLWSLRRPTDAGRHPAHEAVRARVSYLPEYLHEAPLRVLRAVGRAARLPGFGGALGLFLRDLARDRTRNRVRRFGQACVLAAERADPMALVYAHFLHTPGSVARYAARMRGVPWGFSAHARDIFTTPEREKREKLADAAFGFVCSRAGLAALAPLAPAGRPVRLVYHGLDLAGLPAPPAARPPRDGRDPADPVRIVSVGRAVEKKGYAGLLDALALLPGDLAWRLDHIGGGPLAADLARRAAALGLGARVAFLGKRTRPEVMAALAGADLFALAPTVAADGDRDGLPNVLMEAASQSLAIVSTRLSAIPEFVEDGATGVLAEPSDAAGLAAAIAALARDPTRRAALGAAARARLVARFDAGPGLDAIAATMRGATAVGAAPLRAAAE